MDDRPASAEELRQAIKDYLDGRLCVQAWLGIGSAIFIGFGDDIIPGLLPSGMHAHPPYELQTLFADWRVECASEVLGTSDDTRDVMAPAIEALIGHRLLDWLYEPALQALTLLFECGLSLHFVPYVDEDFSNGESWWLVSLDDDHVIGANSDLTVSEGRFHVTPDDL